MRIFFSAVLLGVMGCSQPAPEIKIDPTKDRLGKIAQTYMQSQQELQRAPTSIGDLKATAKKRGFGDEIFTSENDGQPFVIVWGVDVKRPHTTMPILAHEKAGKDGKKWAVDMMMTPHHFTDDELKKAKAGS